MTERLQESPWLRLIGGIIVSVSLAFSPQSLAQEEADEADEEEDVREEIIVTGSRLKRDTYTSIAPLQIITSRVSREVGLIDAADILQESTAAAGQQIDLTFQGFVLGNGENARLTETIMPPISRSHGDSWSLSVMVIPLMPFIIGYPFLSRYTILLT